MAAGKVSTLVEIPVHALPTVKRAVIVKVLEWIEGLVQKLVEGMVIALEPAICVTLISMLPLKTVLFWKVLAPVNVWVRPNPARVALAPGSVKVRDETAGNARTVPVLGTVKVRLVGTLPPHPWNSAGPEACPIRQSPVTWVMKLKAPDPLAEGIVFAVGALTPVPPLDALTGRETIVPAGGV